MATNNRQIPEVDAVSTRRPASATQMPQADSSEAADMDPSAVLAMSGHDRVNTAEARNVIVHNHGPAVAFYARPVDKATNGLTRGTAATG